MGFLLKHPIFCMIMNSFLLAISRAVIAFAAIASTASVGTTANYCLGEGETCLSFNDGVQGTCCGGSSLCTIYDPTVGVMTCAPSTTSSCLAEGELCLSIYEGSKGQCCGGSSSCSSIDLAAGGFRCVNEATTTSFPPKMLQ